MNKTVARKNQDITHHIPETSGKLNPTVLPLQTLPVHPFAKPTLKIHKKKERERGGRERVREREGGERRRRKNREYTDGEKMKAAATP